MQRLGLTVLAAVTLLSACTGSGHSANQSVGTAAATGAGRSTASSAPTRSTESAEPGEGSSSGGAEGAITDEAPCRIVATASFASAFAATVGAVTAGSGAGGSQQCQAKLLRSNLGSNVTIYLSRYPTTPVASFAAAKRAAIAHGAKPVAGLGDDAYFTPTAVNLQYRSGQVAGAAQAQLTGASSPSRLAQALADLTKLAKVVLANQ